jgi:hypothetical protein
VELLPSGGLLERDVPKLAIHRINGDSIGTKNSPAEFLFYRELPAQGKGINLGIGLHQEFLAPRQGILPRNGIPP